LATCSKWLSPSPRAEETGEYPLPLVFIGWHENFEAAPVVENYIPRVGLGEIENLVPEIRTIMNLSQYNTDAPDKYHAKELTNITSKLDTYHSALLT